MKNDSKTIQAVTPKANLEATIKNEVKETRKIITIERLWDMDDDFLGDSCNFL